MTHRLLTGAVSLACATATLGLTACDTVVVHPTRTVVRKETKKTYTPRATRSSGVYHGGSISGGGSDSTSFQSSFQ